MFHSSQDLPHVLPPDSYVESSMMGTVCEAELAGERCLEHRTDLDCTLQYS
jgi:hypothetical protein